MSRFATPVGVWLELTRPGNAVAAGVLTFIGAFVASDVRAAPVAVGAAVLATVAATGGGNAINDYFDREIDAVNQPDRPIPRGAISAKGALRVSAGLFGVATLAALTLPPAAIAIAVFNLLALVAYTELFKGAPGDRQPSGRLSHGERLPVRRCGRRRAVRCGRAVRPRRGRDAHPRDRQGRRGRSW